MKEITGIVLMLLPIQYCLSHVLINNGVEHGGLSWWILLAVFSYSFLLGRELSAE